MDRITGDERHGDDPRWNAVIDFYRAFNQADLRAMEHNWGQGPAISMANPLGGIRVGWDEIATIYASIFHGPARVSVTYRKPTLIGDQRQFFVVGREHGWFETPMERIELHIRTSRVFQLELGVWKQVHHHGSIEDPILLEAYERVVRGSREVPDGV